MAWSSSAAGLRTAVRLLLLGLFLSTEPASSVGDFKRVSVFSGETATLPCSAPYSISDFRKITVEWIKRGLEDSYVLMFRDGRLEPNLQDSSYKSRVELAEPELKNRSLSMILKNVTEKDEGRYECHFIGAAARKKRSISDTKPIKTIDLEVKDFEKVSVFSGKTATLPCSAPYSISDFRKTTVEWTKPGLEDSYVLMFRDGRLDPDEQDPSYESRVDLAEPELKNRNLSMILKNVTKKDEGLYECHFIEAAARQRRSISGNERIKTIDLEVKEKPGYEKNVGGSIEGGSNEGGSNEGGSNEGGSNEGGRARIIAGIMCGVVLGGVVFFVLPKIKKRVLNFRKNTEGINENQDVDPEQASLSGSGPGPKEKPFH